MWFEISLVFLQFIIHFNRNDYVTSHPMFGPNVRYVEENEFPYVVSIAELILQNSVAQNFHACTGVLITRQDVLTAGHCIHQESWQNCVVIVGSVDFQAGTRYSILWWISYNEWIEQIRHVREFEVNDIGTIRLQQKVSENFNIATLSPLSPAYFYNKNAVVAGWGRNEHNNLPTMMRTAQLIVLRMRECSSKLSRILAELILIHNRYICTYADPHVVMNHGDSGNPVFYNGMVIAIHKSTMPFPGEVVNPQKINIHTTIHYYRNFITATTDSNFTRILQL